LGGKQSEKKETIHGIRIGVSKKKSKKTASNSGVERNGINMGKEFKNPPKQYYNLVSAKKRKLR
jgi:hypothetical protein